MKRLTLILTTICLAFSAFAKVNVDILVAYDTTAQIWLNKAGISAQDFAESQIALANQALANSLIDDAFSFRLVGIHSGTFTYNRSIGLGGTIEEAISSNGSGWVALRSARDDAGADIVAIFADIGVSSGESGRASGMLPTVQMNGSGDYIRQWGLDFSVVDKWLDWFAERAYAIVGIGAANRTTLFVHELGHVMGAGHPDLDSFNEPGPQLYHYSSGLMKRGSDGEYYSTVMGYDSDGSDNSPHYTVLPYFSSPNVFNPETGEPLGDDDHNNALTLRNTCSAVAGFRREAARGGNPGENIIPVAKNAVFAAKKALYTGALMDGDDVIAITQFTVAATKKGISSVSGTITGINGKKSRIKNTKCIVFGNEDGTAFVTLEGIAVAGFTSTLCATLGSDGSISNASIGELDIVPANIGTEATASDFYLTQKIETILGVDALQSIDYDGTTYQLLPYADSPERILTGTKWKVAANVGKIKLVKDRKTGSSYLLPVLGTTKSNTNLSALKLSYQGKTGIFKGSFNAYTIDNGKLKKYKFNISGIVLDGIGHGIATCKKAGLSYNVTIEKK